MRATVSPLSSLVLMLSVQAMRAVSVLWFLWNPDWETSSCGLEETVDDGPELGSDDLAGLVEDVVGARVCWGARVDGSHGFADFFVIGGGPGVQ
ncbi:hypothetical protein NDU88_001637 [Pleurodeles waltl]|uniref:Secreted protein n=1 Tax=Pleurodeles waltl TaxID=8319 RepID=A0AAV7T0G3_PLEWA|nr:hypothetical protein NDU88_001637 [Pleurodeles waltl]